MMKANSNFSRSHAGQKAAVRITLSLSLLGLCFAAGAQGESVTNTDSPAPQKLIDARNQPPAAQAAWPENRYQAFSNRAVLPTIQATEDGKAVRVGSLGQVQLGQLKTLSLQDAKIVAGALGVPTGLVVQVGRQAGEAQGVTAEEVVRQLRTAVIDYRYLQAELTAYQPPAPQEPARRAALVDLMDGSLSTVWKYYLELPRPQPPSGLRVVASQP